MCLSLQTGNRRLKVLESYNWKFVVERWLNAMQYQTKEGDCSVDCASQGSFAEEDSCDCGGMSTPGHWAVGGARRRQVVARPRRKRWEGPE